MRTPEQVRDQVVRDDPVEEVRRMRERIAMRFGNDLEAYGEYLPEYQKKFGDRLVLPADDKDVDRPAA